MTTEEINAVVRTLNRENEKLIEERDHWKRIAHDRLVSANQQLAGRRQAQADADVFEAALARRQPEASFPSLWSQPETSSIVSPHSAGVFPKPSEAGEPQAPSEV